MIQFTDDELRRIQQSVEFAYDANETLMIAKKIDAYLTVKTQPHYFVRAIQWLALLEFHNQMDDLPQLRLNEGLIFYEVSSDDRSLWRGLGKLCDDWVVQQDYIDHLRNEGLSEFADKVERAALIKNE